MEAKIKWVWNDKQWYEALAKSSSDRMGMACLELERDVKSNFGVGGAPNIITGRLKSSITSNWTDRKGSGRQSLGGDPPVSNPGGSWPVMKGVVGTNVFYGENLEKGIHGSPLKPFLRPALERNRNRINRLFYEL